MTAPLNIIFDNVGIWLLGYIESSLAVYIFHKSIISCVLCGYEVQMSMLILIFSESQFFFH